MPCVLALMFHGIDGPRARAAGYAADPHYSVEAGRFAALLDALVASGHRVGAARDLLDMDDGLPQVWITFDDGDASNLEEALPLLAARGLKADFFINPARVGRPGFLDWGAVRHLAAAGMSLQSHGQTHTYFTHLAPAALREELRVSKAQIEQATGMPVSLLAPPGGRVPRGLVPLARTLGYRAVLGSCPGVIRGEALAGEQPLPRVAVTRHHTVDEVMRLAAGGESALRRLRWRYRVLESAKALLGDARYERWRARALGSGA